MAALVPVKVGPSSKLVWFKADCTTTGAATVQMTDRLDYVSQLRLVSVVVRGATGTYPLLASVVVRANNRSDVLNSQARMDRSVAAAEEHTFVIPLASSNEAVRYEYPPTVDFSPVLSSVSTFDVELYEADTRVSGSKVAITGSDIQLVFEAVVDTRL